MSAPAPSVSSIQNTLKRSEVRPPVFEKEPSLFLERIPRQSLPVRVAMIGNHLPRQCGIATFTKRPHRLPGAGLVVPFLKP
jgi:hypothetical protein